MASVTLKVSRKNSELVPPAEPTPHEFKYLSVLDDLDDAYRFKYPMIHFYRKSESMEGKDLVGITRDAIAKALVFYYPLAGRLREYDGRKLAVECTGEGVVFIEADTDVELDHFGDALYPPFPCMEELVPDSAGIFNAPLLLFQVTRLRCGGFILAYRFSHSMCDGVGLFQFLSAVAELARGAALPSIPPVWERHLLNPKRETAVPAGTTTTDVTTTPTPPDHKMVQRNFFFGAADISALRRSLPPHLQSCSKFEVVAACAWRCWTIAISPKPDEKILFGCAMDIRKRMKPPFPAGYYGNALVPMIAVTTAEKLLKHPLHYAVELVRSAKREEVTQEYIAAAMGMRDEGSLPAARVFVVSALTQLRYERVDLGWGPAAYGGVAKAVSEWSPVPVSWYIAFTDKAGQQGIMVPVYLPPVAMEKFVKQLQFMITTLGLQLSAL